MTSSADASTSKARLQGDLTTAMAHFESLPTEGPESLQDNTDYPVFQVRDEAAGKELPENARTVERKAEQKDGRQADRFNPSLVDRKPQQQRQR